MKKFAASLASSAFLAATVSCLSVDSQAKNEQVSGEPLLRGTAKDTAKESPKERTGKGKETPNIFTPPIHDVYKDHPIASVTTTTGGLGAYYNVPWTLTTKQYFRDESYGTLLSTINAQTANCYPIAEAAADGNPVLSNDDYLILPLSSYINDLSFCVTPGQVTYIWSKFKVCTWNNVGASEKPSPTFPAYQNVFINVIKNGDIDQKANCDTKSIASTGINSNCWYCVLDFTDTNSSQAGDLFQIGAGLVNEIGSDQTHFLTIDAIYLYTNIYTQLPNYFLPITCPIESTVNIYYEK